MKEDENNSESIIRASKILASSLLFGAMLVAGVYGEYMTLVNNSSGALLIKLSLIPLYLLVASWRNFSFVKWVTPYLLYFFKIVKRYLASILLGPRIQKIKKDLHDYYQERSPKQNTSQQPTGDSETR